MKLGTAIEKLVDNYKYASDKEWIRNKVAWALYHTWKEADRKTENSSEKPNNCECEPRKEQNFCGKCRYLYRDFKYGLSCYRLMDNEPCKYEERKTEPTISKMEQVDKDINVLIKDEPQTEDEILREQCRAFMGIVEQTKREGE